MEVMDAVLIEYYPQTRSGLVDFVVWSDALDAHVVTRTYYGPVFGLSLMLASGDPACDYYVINSKECLEDAKELVKYQRDQNNTLN